MAKPTFRSVVSDLDYTIAYRAFETTLKWRPQTDRDLERQSERFGVILRKLREWPKQIDRDIRRLEDLLEQLPKEIERLTNLKEAVKDEMEVWQKQAARHQWRTATNVYIEKKQQTIERLKKQIAELQANKGDGNGA